MSSKYLSQRLITNDVWLAAYLLCAGCELYKLVRNDRRRISFVFTGPDVRRLREEYDSGVVRLNVRSFRDNLVSVRRRMDHKHPPSSQSEGLRRDKQRSAPCPRESRKLSSPV